MGVPQPCLWCLQTKVPPSSKLFAHQSSGLSTTVGVVNFLGPLDRVLSGDVIWLCSVSQFLKCSLPKANTYIKAIWFSAVSQIKALPLKCSEMRLVIFLIVKVSLIFYSVTKGIMCV